VGSKKETPRPLPEWIVGRDGVPMTETITGRLRVRKDGSMVFRDRKGIVMVIQSGCGAYARRVEPEPGEIQITVGGNGIPGNAAADALREQVLAHQRRNPGSATAGRVR
jgi:hypothetical protein